MCHYPNIVFTHPSEKSQYLIIIALERAHHLILTFFVSPSLSLQLAVS